MPDEIQEWQKLQDLATRIAEFAAKKVRVLKAARIERRRSSHLKIVGVWLGGTVIAAAAIRDYASQNRAAFAGLAIGAVTTGGIATIACQDDGPTGREARPRATIQAPANPGRTVPTTQPPKVTPRATPSPTPTRVPTVPIPATPAPAPEPLATEPTTTTPRKTKSPKPPGNNGRPPTRPPVTRPPTTPPGQAETLGDCLIHREVIWDIRLFC